MDFFKHTILKVDDLIPYALNSRTHSDDQIAQIAASIREFGFTNPVLIDEDNNLIAGHGRVLAARKLKLKKVPAIVVIVLDDRKRRALVFADNKLALSRRCLTTVTRLRFLMMIRPAKTVKAQYATLTKPQYRLRQDIFNSLVMVLIFFKRRLGHLFDIQLNLTSLAMVARSRQTATCLTISSVVPFKSLAIGYIWETVQIGLLFNLL